jgi:uncharacterized Fe-S cluster-containing protein
LDRDRHELAQQRGRVRRRFERRLEPDRDSARSKANEIKDRQVRKIEGLLDQYNKLKSRAEEFKQDKTRDKAEKILDDIRKEFDRIEKLKDKGAWRGTSHPLIQYAVEYGKGSPPQHGVVIVL